MGGMTPPKKNLSARGRGTCPSANLPTANPTWTDPGSHPVLRDERSATNRLSHVTAPPNHIQRSTWRSFFSFALLSTTHSSGSAKRDCEGRLDVHATKHTTQANVVNRRQGSQSDAHNVVMPYVHLNPTYGMHVYIFIAANETNH